MSERMRKPGASELAELGKARERTEYIKCGLFLELIKDALAQETSPVVFLNYREPLARLRELLKENGINNVSMIHGEQSLMVRDVEIADFQSNKNHVALVITAAGGTGVSLHDVHNARPRAAIISPSYNASDVKQCLGRIHRVGGTRSVQTFVLASGTVEEKVYKAITAKLSFLLA